MVAALQSVAVDYQKAIGCQVPFSLARVQATGYKPVLLESWAPRALSRGCRPQAISLCYWRAGPPRALSRGCRPQAARVSCRRAGPPRAAISLCYWRAARPYAYARRVRCIEHRLQATGCKPVLPESSRPYAYSRRVRCIEQRLQATGCEPVLPESCEALFAQDDNLRGGDGEAEQAMAGVEVQADLQVGSAHAEEFEPFRGAPLGSAPLGYARGRPFDYAPFDSAQGKRGRLIAVWLDAAERFNGDAAGRHVLRDRHRKCLRTPCGPVVEPSEHSVLVVEVVVEDDDARRGSARLTARTEGKLLNEGLRAFEL